MARTSEMLHGPMREVRDEAALLGVTRYPSEPDSVFRTRVAYALLIHSERMDGKDATRLQERAAWWDIQAREGLEPLCYGYR